MLLSGKSQTVDEDVYTAWIYCPADFLLQDVQGSTAGGKQVEISKIVNGELIGISFRGGGNAVSWSIRFARADK
jgi:hypothetical protein